MRTVIIARSKLLTALGRAGDHRGMAVPRGLALTALLVLGCDSDNEAGSKTPCPEGRTACSGACIDRTTNPDHCGACGNVCPAGIGCFAGKCTSPGWLNQPREGHALVRGEDGGIFCIGGAHLSAAQITELASVEHYDPSTNTWTEIAPLDTPRWAMGAALLDGRPIAFGGSSAFSGGSNGTTALSVSEEYSPSTNSWNAAAPLQQVRGDFAHATDNEGRIWAFWGWVFVKTDLLPELAESVEVNGHDGLWNTVDIDSGPLPRREARAVTAKDGRIFVLAGVDFGFLSDNADVFDPATRSWSQANAMPNRVALGAAALLPDGRIFYVGGTHATSPAIGVRDALAYDPVNDSWESLAPLPVGLWDTAAVTGVDGRVYVVGGTVKDGTPALERVFVYDPERNRWYE